MIDHGLYEDELLATTKQALDHRDAMAAELLKTVRSEFAKLARETVKLREELNLERTAHKATKYTIVISLKADPDSYWRDRTPDPVNEINYLQTIHANAWRMYELQSELAALLEAAEGWRRYCRLLPDWRDDTVWNETLERAKGVLGK